MSYLFDVGALEGGEARSSPSANAHAHTVDVLAQWRSLRAAVERLKVRLSSSATSVGGLTQFSNREPC